MIGTFLSTLKKPQTSTVAFAQRSFVRMVISHLRNEMGVEPGQFLWENTGMECAGEVPEVVLCFEGPRIRKAEREMKWIAELITKEIGVFMNPEFIWTKVTWKKILNVVSAGKEDRKMIREHIEKHPERVQELLEFDEREGEGEMMKEVIRRREVKMLKILVRNHGEMMKRMAPRLEIGRAHV